MRSALTIFSIFLLFLSGLTVFLGCFVLGSDIDYDFLDLGAGRAQYLVGETVELWLTIVNTGSQRINANTLQINFSLILPNGSQIDIGERWNLFEIEPNTYEPIAIEWVIPHDAVSGIYDCQVSAVHLPTSLAKNQTFYNVFEVLTSPPDIDLVACIYVNGMFYESGASVNVGEEKLNITYIVFNVGTQDAGPFFVKFRFYGFGTTFVETRNYDGLAHGCSIKNEKVFSVYLNEKYLVHMQVDYLGQVYESNETNNDKVVFIKTYAYPKVLQRLEITFLNNSWRMPNSQFIISLWDVSDRPLDILTSLAIQQEDILLFHILGEFNDIDGDSVINNEEVKDSLLKTLEEGPVNEYLNFLNEKIRLQSVLVEPDDLRFNFWNFATQFAIFLLNSIEESGATPIENVKSVACIFPVLIGEVSGGTMTISSIGGYSEGNEIYTPIVTAGNGLRNTIVTTLGPIDLSIVDSNGRAVNKTINEVNGALYEEKDMNNDGLFDDVVTLPPSFIDYKIQVIPEPTASPESTVILKIISGSTSLTIERTNVSDILTRTYYLRLADTTAPNIQEILITPSEYVEPYQPVKVQAKIVDDQKIANVTFYYTTNNETFWEALSMEYNQTSGYYETTIPGQPAGTKVKFRISVYDNAGNRATASETRQNCTYEVIPEFPLNTIITLFIIILVLVALLKTLNIHNFSVSHR